MYALEITFQDAASPTEMIFVRRPQALVGSSEFAHVILEDLKPLGYQVRLVRDLGRKFICKPTGSASGQPVPPELDRTYKGQATLILGAVRLQISALDLDLLIKDGEPPDKAGVRIMRRACAVAAPVMPAVVVKGDPPLIVSFVPDQPLIIGRSRHCGLRLDAADISGKHARMGFEGGEFWIEDLGSTNGTYVNQQQISGRVNVPPGAGIVLGREITVTGVTSEDQIVRASAPPEEAPLQPHAREQKYPVLFSVSEVARPAKLVLQAGTQVTMGRDPACEMWLGAPHVSRRHCTIAAGEDGVLTLTDTSTNGTALDDGSLIKGETVALDSAPRVLDFGAGVSVAVCFDEEQEREFVLANGASSSFMKLQPRDIQARGRKRTITRSQGAAGQSWVLALLKQLLLEWRDRRWPGKLLMVAVVALITMVVVIMAKVLLPIFERL